MTAAGPDHDEGESSARRVAEDALRAEEARLRHLIESAPDGIVVSRDGVILDANPAAARMLGYDLGRDLVGLSLYHLMSPAATKTMIARVAVAREGGAGLVPRTYEARRRDGSSVIAEITSVPYVHDGRPAVMGFARDVTDRVRLEEELARSERLAALGTLAAGVAHEINTPLTVMNLVTEALDARLQRVLERGDEGTRRELRELLQDLRGGVDRVAGIVRELRTFARTDDEVPGPTDVLAALAGAERMVSHQLRHRARVSGDYGELPLAVAHGPRLEQVFVNILLNAAQALPEGRAENRIDLRSYIAKDGRVAVEVTDNGAGMSPAVVHRVFDPFFTTKPLGEGTGLGLAISHGIVTRLGGEIVVESEVGRGTTVRVLLLPVARVSARGSGDEPFAEASVARPGTSAGNTPARRRVLVVDDEASLVASLRTLLEHEHDVTTVSSGDAACRLLLHGSQFDVILCDLMMPVMSGMDVHARVAASQPALLPRFVFMTGGAFTARATAFLESIPNRVLEKPFGWAEVQRVIVEAGAAV